MLIGVSVREIGTSQDLAVYRIGDEASFASLHWSSPSSFNKCIDLEILQLPVTPCSFESRKRFFERSHDDAQFLNGIQQHLSPSPAPITDE